MTLPEHIDPHNIPDHIAIIMDGNGRWAQMRQRPRAFGHMMGVESVRKVITAATRIGVKYLTLYTFSEDNWARPGEEVKALMKLLVDSIDRELPELRKEGVRLSAIGNLSRLPKEALGSLRNAIETTRSNSGTHLILALSYSAKEEILHACKMCAHDHQEGKPLSEEIFERYLYTAGIPNPDLMIRTGGECRLSNFLLWQCAYSELYFTPIFWPDFGEEDFYEAVRDYQSRQRRFGKTGDQITREESSPIDI